MALGDILNIGPQGSGAPGGPVPSQGMPAPAPQAPARNISQEWTDFLNQPGNRAAMIQLGVNLLQPIGLGQSTLGHIGQAIGAAGEAKTRVLADEAKNSQTNRELDIRQQEADARSQAVGMATAVQRKAMQDANSFEAFVLKIAQSEVESDLTLQTTLSDAIANIYADPSKVAQLQQQWIQLRSAPTGGLAAAVPGGGQAPQPAPGMPKVGETRVYQGKTYRFMGGANTQANWQVVQ